MRDDVSRQRHSRTGTRHAGIKLTRRDSVANEVEIRVRFSQDGAEVIGAAVVACPSFVSFFAPMLDRIVDDHRLILHRVRRIRNC